MLITKDYPSSSSSATYRAVLDTATGKATCNCPGWTRRAVRECKHTKLLAAGAAPGPSLELPAEDVPSQGGSPEVKPMLASPMKEGQSLDDFTGPDYVMEEKFDGHRLSVVVQNKTVTAWSRPGAGRPSAVRDLPSDLARDLAALPDGQYDGELCVPGGTSSDVVRLDMQNELIFVMFDIVRLGGESLIDWSLAARRNTLELAHRSASSERRGSREWPLANSRVRIAQQGPVSMDTVRAIWAEGGEGAIIKRLASTYRSGWRTPDWVKVKNVGSAELTITGFEAGKNGPCSVFKLRHADGRETKCKVLTDELIRRVHANPEGYIGERVTISFMGMTPGKLWRHPIFDHFTDREDA